MVVETQSGKVGAFGPLGVTGKELVLQSQKWGEPPQPMDWAEGGRDGLKSHKEEGRGRDASFQLPQPVDKGRHGARHHEVPPRVCV